MLGDYIFAIGGRISATVYSLSIESLNVISRQAWCTLVVYNKHIKRVHSAVAAISADKLAIFGGNFNRSTLKSGYIFNVQTNELRPIPGKAEYLKFQSLSQTHWIKK